jgi:hypothetical protein
MRRDDASSCGFVNGGVVRGRARGSGTRTNAKSRRWSCRHCLLDLYRNMNYLSRKRNVVLLKESRGFETRFEHYIPNALLQLPGAV